MERVSDPNAGRAGTEGWTAALSKSFRGCISVPDPHLKPYRCTPETSADNNTLLTVVKRGEKDL